MADEVVSTRAAWRDALHRIIFEADTPAGKLFDIGLIGSILLSVLAVMLESVDSIRAEYHSILVTVEWYFTVAFSVEYLLRLICIGRPLKYATSFFGVVDLLSVLPTYISLLIPGTEVLLVIRILRVLRIFRVLKLGRFTTEATVMVRGLKASTRKVVVFFFTVFALVVIIGAVMYLVEGDRPDTGFTSIPRSIYWAIVTMTTVGYGDVTPKTPLGQGLAALVMVLGFSIIAIPTGILASEMSRIQREVSTQSCPECSKEGHDPDAKFCKACGMKL